MNGFHDIVMNTWGNPVSDAAQGANAAQIQAQMAEKQSPLPPKITTEPLPALPKPPPEMIPGTNIPSHGIPEQGWGPEGKTGKSFDGETNDYMEIIPKNNKDRIWFPPPEHDEFDEHAPRKEWEA